MSRLPTVGGDQDSWGTVLNDFLEVSHNDDGTLRTGVLDGSLSWRLSGTHNVGATTINLGSAPVAVGANLGFVIIDPYTTEAEVRKVTGVGAASFTISGGLTYAHASGDPVLWFPGGLIPWSWWGGKGGGSQGDATTNVLAFNRLAQQIYNLGSYFRGGILIPQGIWYIDDELHPERDMAVQGVHPMTSRIVAKSGFPFDGTRDRAMIRVMRDGTLVTDANPVSGRWYFRDFYLDGALVTNANGLMSSPQQPDQTRNIRIDNCPGYGMYLVDVQEHQLQKLQFLSCGTALLLRAVRMLWMDGFNSEVAGVHHIHSFALAGDTNASRWIHFENIHTEHNGGACTVAIKFDSSLASGPTVRGLHFNDIEYSTPGTSNTWLQLVDTGTGNKQQWTIENMDLNGTPASTTIVDDGPRGITIGDGFGLFNSHIDRITSQVDLTSDPSTRPEGIHQMHFHGSSGQQARVGTPRGQASAPVGAFWSNQVTDNEWHARYYSSGTLVGGVTRPGYVLTPRVLLGATTGPVVLSGSGSPEGSVTAPVGSVYSRTNGGASTTLYVKESGAGNTGWLAYGPSGIAASLLDAKGDIIAASANDTAARVAVGTNGQVLTADSGQAAGVKWDDPPASSGSAISRLHFISGSYYGPYGGFETGGSFANGSLRLMPFEVHESTTFDRIGVNVTTQGGTGSVIRLGIFEDDGAIGPGTLVLDAGTVVTETTGRKEITISQALAAGVYWIGCAPQGAPSPDPIVSRMILNGIFGGNAWAIPQGTNANFATACRGFVRTGITGALSTLTAARADFESSVDMPMTWLRVA